MQHEQADTVQVLPVKHKLILFLISVQNILYETANAGVLLKSANIIYYKHISVLYGNI